jgi:hypothetical protein
MLLLRRQQALMLHYGSLVLLHEVLLLLCGQLLKLLRRELRQRAVERRNLLVLGVSRCWRRAYGSDRGRRRSSSCSHSTWGQRNGDGAGYPRTRHSSATSR